LKNEGENLIKTCQEKQQEEETILFFSSSITVLKKNSVLHFRVFFPRTYREYEAIDMH